MEQPPRNLNPMRVAELREIDQKLGLPTGGTKAELIARIRDYYRAHPQPTPVPTPTPTPTPTLTRERPKKRRQNPFETIDDIAGMLGAVLQGRAKFEDVKDLVRRDLGTY